MILGYWVILGLNWGYRVILGYLYRLWEHCVGVRLELESVIPYLIASKHHLDISNLPLALVAGYF